MLFDNQAFVRITSAQFIIFKKLEKKFKIP